MNNKLSELVNKIFKPLAFKDKKYIKELIEKSKNIKQTLQTISNIVTNEFIKMKCIRDEYRQDFIVSKILIFIRAYSQNRITEQTRFVDIGGGNGNVLQQMNSTLDLIEQKHNFICVETQTDWIETYDYNNKNISYVL